MWFSIDWGVVGVGEGQFSWGKFPLGREHNGCHTFLSWQFVVNQAGKEHLEAKICTTVVEAGRIKGVFLETVWRILGSSHQLVLEVAVRRPLWT